MNKIEVYNNVKTLKNKIGLSNYNDNIQAKLAEFSHTLDPYNQEQHLFYTWFSYTILQNKTLNSLFIINELYQNYFKNVIVKQELVLPLMFGRDSQSATTNFSSIGPTLASQPDQKLVVSILSSDDFTFEASHNLSGYNLMSQLNNNKDIELLKYVKSIHFSHVGLKDTIGGEEIQYYTDKNNNLAIKLNVKLKMELYQAQNNSFIKEINNAIINSLHSYQLGYCWKHFDNNIYAYV